jgi:signal transduction histidine kinase
MKSSSILQKGLLIVLVPFAINLIWIGLFWHSLQRSAVWIETIHRDGDVMLLVSRSVAFTNKIIINIDEYVKAAGSATLKKEVEVDVLSLFDTLKKLSNVTRDDAAVSAITARLSSSISSFEDELRALGEVPNPLEIDFRKVMRTGCLVEILHDSNEMMSAMKQREYNFNRTLEMEDRERHRTKLIAFAGLGLNIVIAVVLAVFLQRGITARLAMLTRKVHSLKGDGWPTESIGGEDELTQLDRELLAARYQLQAAYAFRHKFMSTMAKNIEEPLNACIDASTDLEQNEPSLRQTDGQKQLRALRSSASSCLRLIEDMLLLESLESGSLRIELRPAEIKAVTADAIALVANLALAKNISIVNEVEGADSAMDQARIKQVLVNLIANAIKFSPANTVIKIQSKRSAANLRLSVIDNGPGIDKRIRSRLFQKFSQGEESKATGGTGLGLAISKLIIDAHQGLIGVDSVPGRGSTFWFEIPANYLYPEA